MMSNHTKQTEEELERQFMADAARNKHEESVLNACKKIAGW